MLVTKVTKRVNGEKQERIIRLVPELSYLMGLTDAMRSDFKVMKDVAAFTWVPPGQRSLALRTYLERVKQSEEAQNVLAGWGLILANGTGDLDVRVIPQEAIYFGGPQAEERKYVGGSD